LHWVVGMESFPLKRFREGHYEPGLLARLLGMGK
jgi:hypothetical protein